MPTELHTVMESDGKIVNENFPSLSDLEKRNLTIILNRLQSEGQRHIAAALEISEGEICKWKGERLPRFARLLAALGLKAVSADKHCIKTEVAEEILSAAKKHWASIKSAADLEWDDE